MAGKIEYTLIMESKWLPIMDQRIRFILFATPEFFSSFKDMEVYKGKVLLVSSQLCSFSMLLVKGINILTERQHFASKGTDVLLFAQLPGVLPNTESYYGK